LGSAAMRMRVVGGVPVGAAAGAENPFVPHDDWVVFPSGDLMVVHASPYRVESIVRGKSQVGPIIPVKSVPVTAEDKQAVAAALAKTQRALAASGAWTTKNASGGKSAERNDWPAFKPSFVAGSARADGTALLWVERHGPAAEQGSTFDVFDRTGNLIAHVRQAKRSRLVGLSVSFAFVAETDSTERERIVVFRRPSFGSGDVRRR
jgi:hypothetical protein